MGKRELIELAREMRKRPTVSEDVFWQAVRNRQFIGAKFRRQQVIEQFIVDFYVPSHCLVVEIDGGIHCQLKESDEFREQFLRECGLRVLRFTDTDVEQNLAQVLDVVQAVLVEQEKKIVSPSREPLPQPLSGKRRGE